ncbi:protein AGENET DOMAIN (AGD)-CONTAINING P1 [Salvia miltiorrhiza]|uniref:protein AGENET DOMAIN (AGD)-CONTAINING P1 n=1 Tax=Salvia miltiorrhiza TaxID=226208 RepID=UPI0025AB6DF3|nr:protein AGENET DOMAIN (AGD)-CONTAINING P1 [Salvia miltiorrhiza]
MAGAGQGSILRYFKKGAEVEISSNDEGFRGSWFAGTVIRAPKNESSKVLVQYKTLTADEAGKQPLREPLDVVQLRPPPPRENRPVFKFSDEVDAYYNDGWWEGVITMASEGEDEYMVFFRGTREQLPFTASQLRLHREWVNGKWVPPLEPSSSSSTDVKASSSVVNPSSIEAEANKVVIEFNFNPGDLVESCSDEEGFEGAWFPATVLEKTAAGKYLIEYKTLTNDDDTGLLREEVDELHLRPSPPDVGVVDRFEVDEKVDAFYNDCWWVGAISKVLQRERYSVYFENSGDELKFEHSDLRVHQEWRNGKWHIAS